MELNRRGFLGVASAGVAAGFVGTTRAAPVLLEIPDTGWKLWIDREARYLDDRIFLPSDVNLATLPVNPPTGGWNTLDTAGALTVTLPTTVEEHLWGKFGERPYTADEYRYAETDPVPQNGAYRGVSWWYRSIDIPAAARGKRVMLHVRGARMRAEIQSARDPHHQSRRALRLARFNNDAMGGRQALPVARLWRARSRPDA
jgi:beta-galactosidase